MSRIGATLMTALSLVLLAPAMARAHHSFSMFDHTQTRTLMGTVTRFQWTNPHAYIEIEVADASGAVKHFSIECTSINMLQRLGWRSSLIKAGDQVTAVVAPLLNGDPGGLLLELTLPDGRKLDPGVPAANSYKRTPGAD